MCLFILLLLAACNPATLTTEQPDCSDCDDADTDTDTDSDTDADSDTDTDTDTDTDSDTDSDTDADADTGGNPNDGTGNMAITVAYPWGDGETLCLDYEAVTDRDDLGVISGEVWEDAGGCVIVSGGVAVWRLDVGYNIDAVRYDVDFPDGGNLCEGYTGTLADGGWSETAHLLVETGITYGIATWAPGPYSISWSDEVGTYYGCSAAGYAPEE